MRWQTNFDDSGSMEQLQQEVEYTLLKPDTQAGEFQKCNLTL